MAEIDDLCPDRKSKEIVSVKVPCVVLRILGVFFLCHSILGGYIAYGSASIYLREGTRGVTADWVLFLKLYMLVTTLTSLLLLLATWLRKSSPRLCILVSILLLVLYLWILTHRGLLYSVFLRWY